MAQTPSVSLSSWLVSTKRQPSPFSHFEIVDLNEIIPPTQETYQWLAERMRDARFDPAFLEMLATALTWPTANQIINDYMPRPDTLRRGAFGEVLAEQYLTEFDGLTIPISKLRALITSGQSLPGTDVFAVMLDGGSISRVEYLEAKLRGFGDTSVALASASQLSADIAEQVPAILLHVAGRLHDLGSPLCEQLVGFMASRQAGDGVQCFRVFLVIEKSSWSEATLQRLEDNYPSDSLVPLTVSVVLVENLRSVVEEVFSLNAVRPDDADDE